MAEVNFENPQTLQLDYSGGEKQEEAPEPHRITPIDDGMEPVERLEQWASEANLIDIIGEQSARAYCRTLAEQIEADKGTMGEWLRGVDEALKLAKDSSTTEQKTFPWRGASNVNLPNISKSALKFAAKTYAKMMGGTEWAKCEMPGLQYQDEQQQEMLNERLKRVKNYLNFLLQHRIEGYESSYDKMCHQLPWVGCLHRKSYYDPALRRYVKRFMKPHNCIVNNGTTPENERYARFTEVIEISENAYKQLELTGAYEPLQTSHNEVAGYDDSDKIRLLHESECWMDLDGDGYAEPYTVLMVADTHQPLRIHARYSIDDINFVQDENGRRIQSIDPIKKITKYGMFEAFDGGYFTIGWGHLCLGLQEAANTSLNQLADAATMSNARPGVVDSRLRTVDGGDWEFEPGEKKKVTGFMGRPIGDAFHDLDVPEPNPVMFSVLELCIGQIEGLATTPDMIAESTASTAPVGTTLARIEEAERVANGVDKRLYRSQTNEYRCLYDLVRQYGDPADYQRVLNLVDMPLEEVAQMMQADFNNDDMDIVPTANPDMSSKTMRIVQGELLKQVAVEMANMGDAMDNRKVAIEILDGSGIENPARFWPQPTPEDIEAAEDQKAAQELSMRIEIDTLAEQLEKIRLENEEMMRRMDAANLADEREQAEIDNLNARTESERQKPAETPSTENS